MDSVWFIIIVSSFVRRFVHSFDGGGIMLRVRPYRRDDAKEVASWCEDEKTFYFWSAGVLGDYPMTEEKLSFVEKFMPFVAFDDEKLVGFFNFRNIGDTLDELRIGFIILDSAQRGKGYAKQMIRLGLNFAFEVYGAKRVSLAVVANNLNAYHCYKAIGFEEVDKEISPIEVMGQSFSAKEMIIEKK